MSCGVSYIDPNLKRSFEVLGIKETSTFEEAEAAYRLLSQSASWSDIKELNWAYESIKEYFVSQARDGASEAQRWTLCAVGGVARTPGHPASKLFFIGGIICLILIVVEFISLKGREVFRIIRPYRYIIACENCEAFNSDYPYGGCPPRFRVCSQ